MSDEWSETDEWPLPRYSGSSKVAATYHPCVEEHEDVWGRCRPYRGHPAKYQEAAAHAYYVETSMQAHTWEWVSTTCKTDCLNPDHMRFAAPRTLGYAANVCIYCGRSAWTKDHLLPRYWSGDSGRRFVVTVPACQTCNSTLRDTLTWSLTERRKVCHIRLRKHFRKVLKTVEFGPSDLEEFGPTLRAYIEESMAKKAEVLRMLAWPEDPGYDARACHKAGIDDPYELGLVISDEEAMKIAKEVA
jgi:hypothetical protein